MENIKKKNGLENRMADIYFEIEKPDGKKVEISNYKTKNSKKNKEVK